MPALSVGQLCLKIALFHSDGSRLHPVAIKNRQTGRRAWNMARPGTAKNLRSAAIETDDEELLISQILNNRWSVRCQTVDGSHKGLFSPDGKSIVRAERTDPELLGELK